MPNKIPSLNFLTTAGGKAYLAEKYAGVIANVTKNTISGKLKNTDLSGDPDAGTLVAKRFANASSQPYGTARTAGKGQAVKQDDVPVPIDIDREFVEELERKDIKLGGVDGVVQKRADNHGLRMQSELDKAFFACAVAAATKISVKESDSVEDILEEVIQVLENFENDFIDGIPRELMRLTCSTKWYGQIRNNLDKQARSNVDTAAESFYSWHGVECESCTHLPNGVPFVIQLIGSVAQPVIVTGIDAEKVNLGNAVAVELFFSYGTKAVTPETILVPSFYTEKAVANATEFNSAKADLYTYDEATGNYVSAASGTYSADATYYTKN